MRQVGGSIGLSIFATLFTRYGREAATGLSAAVTSLRPEVAAYATAAKARLLSTGVDLNTASAVVNKSLAGRTLLQGTVLGFEKTFILQTIAFLVVLPLLFFLRVKRTASKERAHVEVSTE